MPTYEPRFALTVWYYDTEERAQAVSLARETGSASAVAASR
jgi:hypothetical protein